MKHIAIALCALAMASSAWAQVAPGTWYKRGDVPNIILVVEPAGAGLKITFRPLTHDGKPILEAVMTLVTQLDGKEVPVLVNGKPSGETVAISRIDGSHTSTILKLNGELFGTSKAELSPDGKTLKVENNVSSGATGQAAGTQVEYWDRK